MQIHHIVAACVRCRADRLRNGAARERKTDEGDRGADDDGGHELIDPADAREFDGDRNDDVHKTREHRADEKAQIAKRHRNAACERCRHRADESKGTAQKTGLLNLVNKR